MCVPLKIVHLILYFEWKLRLQLRSSSNGRILSAVFGVNQAADFCDMGFDYVVMAALSVQVALELLSEGVRVDWFLDAYRAAGAECPVPLICHGM